MNKMLNSKQYINIRRIVIILGVVFIVIPVIIQLKFFSTIGLFLLFLTLLFDLFLQLVDFKSRKFRYANYYQLYPMWISEKRRKMIKTRGYTFEEKRSLLKGGIIAHILLLIIIFFILMRSRNLF